MTFRVQRYCWRAGFWCPFRAHRITTQHPGLKPWAELSPPFRGGMLPLSWRLCAAAGPGLLNLAGPSGSLPGPRMINQIVCRENATPILQSPRFAHSRTPRPSSPGFPYQKKQAPATHSRGPARLILNSYFLLLTSYFSLLRQPLLPVFSERIDVVLGDWNQLTLHER